MPSVSDSCNEKPATLLTPNFAITTIYKIII